MLLLALHELLSRRTATLLAGAGLLTATLGFMVLASTSTTTQAVLTGDIGRAWSSPYDLLVRPTNSASPLEVGQGLVRPNFLSGLVGGISMADLAQIRAISGVEVAAPIAVLGFIDPFTAFTVDLSKYLGPGLNVFQLTGIISADSGLSTYPFTYYFVVDTTGGVLHVDQSSPSPVLQLAGGTLTCTYPEITCEAATVCSPTTTTPDHCGTRSLLGASWFYNWPEPILIAGIDPAAENQLVGLDRCVTSGRALNASDGLPMTPDPLGGSIPVAHIPLMAATTTFLEESLQVNVAKTDDPGRIFVSGTKQSLAGWQSVDSVKADPNALYESWLSNAAKGNFLAANNLLVPGAVGYRQVGSNELAATPLAPDLSIFTANNGLELTPQQIAPPEATDTWFRPVSEHAGVNEFTASEPEANLNVVGRYDPNCLPGFNSLAGGRLETYAPPEVKLPNNQNLGPTLNPGGYVNSPPLLLTDLAGAAFMARPDRWQGGAGDRFISAIRIRVSGTGTPGPVAEARLSRVAAAIHQVTGLQVDIVKGSSPKAIGVQLAAGKFGRPALTVTEGWSVKGVDFRFLKAVSAQNLALFGLVLVGAMVLVGETGYISVRRRRREFGVLRGLGWGASSIAWLVELEMLLLGVGAGLVALVAGIPIVSRLGMGTSDWQLAAVIPLAVTIAALAGLVPALTAGRGTAADVMGSIGQAGITKRRPPNGLIGVAWLEMRGQWRAEASLGAAAIALGAAIFGVLVLISVAFRGQLDTTVLGTYLAGQVQPFHLVLASLTLIVGAIAAAEVVTLSYLERRSHLGALRALGWPALAVVKLLAIQASALGLAGGLVSAFVVWTAGVLLQAPYSAIGWGLSAAIGMTIVATSIAVAAPLTLAYRANPADALRGE
jgi:putative ABC transport system permease protein